MKSDIIIGLVVSVGFHVGFLYGGELLEGNKAPPAPPPVEEVIELMEMPTFEPEPEEILDLTEDPVEEVVDFAPPMQTDVPSVVKVDSFVQKLQPPPPPGMEMPKGQITIPKNSVPSNFGRGMSDLFDLANLDQKPVPTYQAQPVYPFEMRRAGVPGEVTVGFIVDSSGRVRDAYAVKSSQREFEQAAIQAVTKWKFRPGKKGGRAVNTKMQVPIVFNISDN